MPTYNKIILNGTTLIDLSTDTVAVANDIALGKVGHLNTGATATGTYSGGGGSASDAVRYLDYDGTVLYSYSAEDFSNLSNPPRNPIHTGLTAKGWNWSLADAKAQVTATGSCDIGQMYTTDDGKTRIYISLTDSARLSPYLGICPYGTVVVDWGDNTTTDTLTGTSVSTVKRVQHTYASTGDYVITLNPTSGRFAIMGTATSDNGTYLLTRTNGNVASQRCYQNSIQKVELGSNVQLYNYAFQHCHSLSSITVPTTLGSLNNNSFQYCYSLKSITLHSGITSTANYIFNDCWSLVNVSLPSTVTTVGSNAFNGCISLDRISIPNATNTLKEYAFASCRSFTSLSIPSGVTTIGSSAFSSCRFLKRASLPSSVTSLGSLVFTSCTGLSSITVPSGVTIINSSTFSNCLSVSEYHFLSTTPPTLSNVNAFNGIPSDCKIYVPSESLTAYQEATNWSEYASYMVGE